jgi:hypothetical protein
VLIQWALPRGVRSLEQQDARGVLRVVQATTALLFLSVVPLVINLYRFGRRVVRHGQLRPPVTQSTQQAESP